MTYRSLQQVGRCGVWPLTDRIEIPLRAAGGKCRLGRQRTRGGTMHVEKIRALSGELKRAAPSTAASINSSEICSVKADRQ